MANMLRIQLKIEVPVNVVGGELTVEQTPADKTVNVYACTDEISCWIGNCTSVEELESIIGENNIMDSIVESASEYEYDCLESVLLCQDYKYIDTTKKVRVATR